MNAGIDLKVCAQRITETVEGYRKVGAAVDFDTAVRVGVPMDVCAFVLPGPQSPTENDGDVAGVLQEVACVFSVVTAVRNVRDATGEAAMDSLKPFREPLFDALIAWSPDADVFGPVTYAGGQQIAFANGTLFYQDDFVTSYFIRVH